ncbi:MAG TPA: chromosomal replication initiator protein DnaA [Caulobacteraceae bacterium]|jgi:chromosomal replication initiator protein|nr:chromosomal replication initiator protein DnaA [Caulobacteraceae bacterium]
MTMSYGGLAGQTMGGSAPGEVWTRAAAALRGELGDATYGSWLGQAALREAADGALALVTPTATARDWVRRNAWRRISELWGKADPLHRPLELKSRVEFETAAGDRQSPLAPVETPAAAVKADAAAKPDARPARGACLQDRFTFETFVPGPANDFAFDMAKRVAAWSDGHFNPVIFHGPFGFGKTHLLNAIAWEASRNASDKKVIYLTAERFLSGFVRALMDKTGPAFKEELRAADLLLIDDVHFVAGKQSSQEELFHTLAALTQDGRRVVLTCDRAPTELAEMDPRLRSHLQAGLVCGIEPADRTLRLGILERKLDLLAWQQGLGALAAHAEVLEFLADRFTDSVRELEGALNTLVARAGAGVAVLSLDEAQTILRPHLRSGEKRITVDEIQKVVAEHYGMRQADLISERRNRAIARPRQAAMWLTKHLTTRSLPDIGRRFGGRDHTTVLHAVRRIEALKADDAQLARDLEVLTRKLRG